MVDKNSMLTVLKSYLLQHKRLSIPGLGTIYIEMVPAQTDYVNKKILAPSFHYRFDKYFDAPDKEFFAYLALKRHIADYEAIRWYNEWAYDLRSSIRTQESVTWDGVGTLKKDLSGEVQFEAAQAIATYYRDVPAERVLRPDARHKVLVGDTEMVKAQEEEVLETAEKKSKWWLYAAIIAVIIAAFLFFHFYKNGWQLASVGNKQTVQYIR